MRVAIIVAFVGLTAGGSAFKEIKEDIYKVDTQQSRINWTGGNVAGGTHSGGIKLSSGTLGFNDQKLVSGSFAADMTSLTVTDLKGGRADQLADHLKNEDFFDAARFPTAVFKVTNVTKGKGKDQVIVSGNLTMRGKSNPISFPAIIHHMGATVHAVAENVKIDRTKFDVKYRSGSIFAGLGDRAISDEFELDIELVASK